LNSSTLHSSITSVSALFLRDRNKKVFQGCANDLEFHGILAMPGQRRRNVGAALRRRMDYQPVASYFYALNPVLLATLALA